MIEYSNLAISEKGLFVLNDYPNDDNIITGIVEVDRPNKEVVKRYGKFESYIFFANEFYIFY